MENEKNIILTINPGSTSTKVAVFENETKLFGLDITHDANILKQFQEINDQREYRKQMILEALEQAGIPLRTVTAFAGRGGAIIACEGGVYAVNDLLLEHASIGLTGKHPASLGAILAHELASKYGRRAYVVNPPVVDEFEPVARVSGLAEIPRESRFHALNQKEVAQRAAAELGKDYGELNLVVAHIGGGISITSHKRGRAVDSTDTLFGDGPLAPTRAGGLAAMGLISLCFSGKYTEKELGDMITKNGGMTDHLGTSDVLEVKQRIQKGDGYAELVYRAMIYQIAKSIGAYAAVLKGDVDAVVLTGGIARDKELVVQIREMVGFLAPVMVYPGEFEMEALCNGVLRVIRGQEQVRQYNGIPPWEGIEAHKLKYAQR